jgi:hypothetical protein
VKNLLGRGLRRRVGCVHQRGERRRIGTAQLQHLGDRGFDAKIERELTGARSEETSQDRAERRPCRQLGFGLPDQGEVTEGEHDPPGRVARRADEPPLLHIAEVIVAQVLVSLEQVTSRHRC